MRRGTVYAISDDGYGERTIRKGDRWHMRLTNEERRRVVNYAKDEVGLWVKLVPLYLPHCMDDERQRLVRRTLRFYRRFYRRQAVP